MAAAPGPNSTSGCFACLFQQGGSKSLDDQEVYNRNPSSKSQIPTNSTSNNQALGQHHHQGPPGGDRSGETCGGPSDASVKSHPHGIHGPKGSRTHHQPCTASTHKGPAPNSCENEGENCRCNHRSKSPSSSSSSSSKRGSGTAMKVDKHSRSCPSSSSSNPQAEATKTLHSSIVPNFQRVINVRPSLSFLPEQDINIVNLTYEIDKKLTTIDEKSPAVLKYRTPHFRATAQLEIPSLEEGESMQVGWIQTCLHMHFVNTYGSHGMTSWEFPEIVSGRYRMVSDADGKQYPWYGAKNEVLKIKGPSPQQTVEVEMNDNFFPQVTWYIPDESFDRVPRLTHIRRKQKFFTFLAVKNLQTGQVHVLRTITWRMELNIGVDPSAPLGNRATLEEPREQQPPQLIEGNVDLPEYALKPPNANNSQTLVWRPHRAKPVVIVPPIQSTVAMTDYVLQTEGWELQNDPVLRES